MKTTMRYTPSYLPTKELCTTKEIRKIKRQPIEWEKIFASHLSDKGLISKICKGLIQFNSKKKSENPKTKT